VTVGGAAQKLHEAGAYRPGTPRLYTPARPVLSLFDHQRLGLVRALAPPPARLIDAGAGRGRFVLAAAEAGYDAAGIEPSDRGTRAAGELGVRMTRASIEDAQIDPGSADVVTLWHVLEHLDAPGPALSEIRAWLRPGGGVLVGVPNLASLQAELGGERWFHLDVPRHRVHFTQLGIRVLLGRRGFSVLATRHVLLEHNPFGMWQSWLSRLTTHPSYVYNLLKRNAPLASPDLAITLAMVPLAPVAALVELAAGRAGRGGTIAVLARRDD
jgi:SAM-dependent methyltransferase